MRPSSLKRWGVALLTTLVTALVSALAHWLGLPGFPATPSRGPAPTELQGRVTAVADGDTLTLLSAGEEHRIRLGGIDAPELSQPHGTQARAALALMCLGRQADVAVQDRDRYGRAVGTVRCGRLAIAPTTAGTDTATKTANTELVKQGHAWVYAQYNHDPTLPAWEQRARFNRWGLWAQARPTPPWEWRQRARNSQDGKK